ncbi:MAG: MBL fold metallo-hydrolase [Methanobacteriaceae archaeon]|nr:MBL fold metallo-hydrolase [Methanobacteriaceae archaeon]
MIFEMIKSTGIAHNSYFLGDHGKASVIDPRRDVDIYIDLAEANNFKIEYIFETHRNEDYIIGSLELAELTGAKILHGSQLDFAYGSPVFDKDTFSLGSLELEVLETPGHTKESISLVIKDKSVSDDAQMVFVGDALFAGEVGRVDFFGKLETPHMAHLLYNSLHQKILPLGDQTIICPSHGAGSVCGADIREQDMTTIGYEKKTNPLLQLSEEEFIQAKVEEKLYTPPYFSQMEINNQNGPKILGSIPYLTPLNAHEVKSEASKGAQIVDVRKPTSFGGGHIPGSINIWREGLGAYAGWFLNYEDPIIIVDDNEQKMDEIKRYLIRLGYDNIYGHLSDGFPSWYMAAMKVENLDMWSVHQLKEAQDNGQDMFLLDVRKLNDHEKKYIKNSHHIWVGEVPLKLNEIPKDQEVIIYCDSGYKSTIAASILQKNGYKSVKSVLGSMGAWLKAEYPVVK